MAEKQLDTSRDEGRALASALKDLSFAVKSLQLYPAASQIVEDAVDRTFSSLAPLITEDRVSIDVLPSHFRRAGQDIAIDSAIVKQLAARLHGHGVARLHLAPGLDQSSLRRLAELVASDREEVDLQGGFDWVLRRERLTGIHADLLQLERLFADGDLSPEKADDVWEALAGDYSEGQSGGQIEWEMLAGNLHKLKEFVGWSLERVDELGVQRDFSQADMLRFVCGRVGQIAATVGSEPINFLVLTVRDLFDRIDPEALVELLADSLEAELPVEATEVAWELSSLPRGEPQEGSSAVDISSLIAQGLDSEQVEKLVLHTVKGHEKSSRRLYGLFAKMMQGREGRPEVTRQIRAVLDQEISAFGSGESLLDNWPKLNEVLQGEAPERFVSEAYQSTLDTLWGDDSSREAWPIDRIQPRFAEMSPHHVLRQKCSMFVSLLEGEQPDEDYETVAAAIETALPELLLQDHFATAERVLATFASHATQESGRTEEQQRIAFRMLERFRRPEVLRGLVRESLGKADQDIDNVTRVFSVAGASVIPVLLEMLATEDTRRVRKHLVSMLATLGEQAIEEIDSCLDDPRWHYVRNIVLIAGETGHDGFVESLRKTLKHEDPRVRRETVVALMRIGGEDAGNLLLDAVEDEDSEVYLLALRALGSIAPKRAAARLMPLLRRPNWRGQNTASIQAAAIALGQIGDKQAVSALRPLTKKPWLFRERRMGAYAAACWAVNNLEGTKTSPPSELVPRIRGSFSRERAGRQRAKR